MHLPNTSQGKKTICEIEIELLQGPKAALLAFGEQLKIKLGLEENNSSKAELGFDLLTKASNLWSFTAHYAFRYAQQANML